MTAARIQVIGPSGRVEVSDGMISVPEDAIPGEEAMKLLAGADGPGWRVLLWYDADLTGDLSDLGPPDAAVASLDGEDVDNGVLFDPAAEWTTDGQVFQDSGDMGGDIQVGDQWSVRWTKPTVNGMTAVVTRWYYEAFHDPEVWTDGTGRHWVEQNSEYQICTDPRSPNDTELWSGGICREVAYTDPAEAAANAPAPTDVEFFDDGAPPTIAQL